MRHTHSAAAHARGTSTGVAGTLVAALFVSLTAVLTVFALSVAGLVVAFLAGALTATVVVRVRRHLGGGLVRLRATTRRMRG